MKIRACSLLASLVPTALLGLTASACGSYGSSGLDDGEPTGTASIAISSVPSDVGCARVSATSDRAVTTDFTVTPGAAALLTMPNIPVGSVLFAATTFRGSCPVQAGAVPTWVTPTPTRVDVASGAAVNVAIQLVPNANASVSLDFDGGAAHDSGATCGAGTTRQAVANRILLPASRADYAYDLNGDGKADDQYGAVVSVLSAQGLDPQGSEDTGVAAGAAVLLVAETSADATLTSDATCARVSLVDGLTPATVDFSGAGHFTANPSSTAAIVAGPLAAGTLDTGAPAVGAAFPVVSAGLAFLGAVVKVPVHVARASFVSASGGVTRGQITGVITAADLSSKVYPAIAAALDARIQKAPTSAANAPFLTLFDTGGCTNPDGTAAASGDKHIGLCEVTGSPILHAVLAPDVHVFDASGHYAPATSGTPDGLSVGFGFTAVGAIF